jgi:hypothetical protein
MLMKPGAAIGERHRLDPGKIIETADHLTRRVSEKLPDSALAGLAAELAQVARQTEDRAHKARQPILAIRIASVLAVCGTLVGVWYLARHIHARWEFGTITEVFEATDAGFNLLVILAGALWSFVTLEARLKRRKALGSIEELRDFIHVIDITQLYYTPDLYNPNPANSPTSLTFDYTYLLFCTEMLGLLSNLAPLYARGAAGDSILRAVSDVEMLAIATTAKLLSKADAVRIVAASR